MNNLALVATYISVLFNDRQLEIHTNRNVELIHENHKCANI